MGLLTWLESTSYSEWILVSATGWPLMLSIHAFGIAVIVGVIFSLNLRILGLFDSIPYTALHSLMGIAWIGIALNVFTGLSIFFTQATTYITSLPFLLKMLFIILGIVNIVYARKTLRREAADWESSGVVTSIGRTLAMSSLVLWVLAVVTGRLIAYL